MSGLAADEEAHEQAVAAAIAGVSDAALGGARLTGPGVPAVAEAAVTSATPFVRGPLLAAMSAALQHHPAIGDDGARRCPTCDLPAPCPSRRALSRA